MDITRTVGTTDGQILFVDEQLSPLASAPGDVPHVGDFVKWGQDTYKVVGVCRYYPVEQESAYKARVTVRPPDLDE